MPTDAVIKKLLTPPFSPFDKGFLSKISQTMPPINAKAATTVTAISAATGMARLPLTSVAPQAYRIMISALFTKCIKTPGNTEPERTAIKANTHPQINW